MRALNLKGYVGSLLRALGLWELYCISTIPESAISQDYYVVYLLKCTYLDAIKRYFTMVIYTYNIICINTA